MKKYFTYYRAAGVLFCWLLISAVMRAIDGIVSPAEALGSIIGAAFFSGLIALVGWFKNRK